MEDEIENIELKPTISRRTFTLRNNVARQVAVNFMPSRQLPQNTLRYRRANSDHNALLEALSDVPDASEKHADIIVHELEQNRQLMEDNPASEELRRTALRDLPQGLTMKRSVRAKLSASVSLRSKTRPISFCKRFKYRVSFAWRRMKDRLRNFFFSIELWYEAIRNIEGHLGSAVGSYFHLLQWLFGLNLIFMLLLISFVVVPQTLHNEEQSLKENISFLDVISGTGGLQNSLLFYGHYHHGDISTSGPLKYNMPFAYFFTMLCLYLTVFAVLCYRTAYLYRRSFIQTEGGLAHVFAGRVFCGWDFSIVTPHAAALNAAGLYHEFKELLSEQSKDPVTASTLAKFVQRLANVAVTAMVLACTAGLMYGLWRLLGVPAAGPRWEICVSSIITAVLAVCPVIFNFIVKLEWYAPRTAFYVTLARTWLLHTGTFVLLFVFWNRSGAECWETSFGQEVYRLVLLDALTSLGVLPAVELVRGFIYKSGRGGAAPQFDIAYNSLTLIYNQSLLWVGALFSPLLVVAVTVKFLLLFYVKKETALRMCHPARKVWRAAQTQALLYLLVTLSLFTTLFVTGSLFLRSSPACGPLAGYERVWQLLTEGVLQLSERAPLRRALLFLARPGVIALLLLTLSVVVYYARAKAQAQQSTVGVLRRLLLLQAQDKDFLLGAIDKVSNGEWLYSPKRGAGAQADNSHTWRYLQDVRKPSNAGFHFDGGPDRRPNGPPPDRRSAGPPPAGDGDSDSSFSWQGSAALLNSTERQDS